MSKELTALERIIETFLDKDSEDIKTVRNALKEGEKIKKALEIFKRNCILSQYPDGTYELAFPRKIWPTDEDAKLLNEVLHSD